MSSHASAVSTVCFRTDKRNSKRAFRLSTVFTLTLLHSIDISGVYGFTGKTVTKADLCSLDTLTWFSISAGYAKCTFLMRFTLRFIRNLSSHSHLNAKSPQSLCMRKTKPLKKFKTACLRRKQLQNIMWL